MDATRTNINPNAALLAFTIGPVQEYIAAARRTQDLFAGSRLLSLLMAKACSAAGWAEHVIYPAQPPAGSENSTL